MTEKEPVTPFNPRSFLSTYSDIDNDADNEADMNIDAKRRDIL